MLRILRTRAHQGHRTFRFPEQEPALPDRFRGQPREEIPDLRGLERLLQRPLPAADAHLKTTCKIAMLTSRNT